MTLVLVVDDEAPMRRALEVNLRARGYEVDLAATGEEALHHAAERPPDIVILDLGLPGMDGLEVIAELRTWTRTPILVLSARGAEADKVAALDAGADDYVAKPFGMDELLARLRASLRRAAPDEDPPVVLTDHFRLDLANRLAAAPDGTAIHLTPTEWRILDVLAARPGHLVTHRQLLGDVWGPGYGAESNYLRVHMANLRRKLEPDPSRPRYLLTEPGIGHRFLVAPVS
jgi:two-component system KDP operon response regulator KdpE